MDGKRIFDRNEVEELVKEKNWEGLRKYDFRGADLSGMHLWETEFDSMDFSGANLSYAFFDVADLKNAKFNGANLDRTSFRSSNLANADFRGTDIAGVDFSFAHMDGVIIDGTTSHFHMCCPEKGEFTGYKKARHRWGLNPYIVELRIPAHALRSSATSNKCRCSEAEVISITRLDGTDDGTNVARSNKNRHFLYKAGERVKVYDFDKNRWNECAPGIHFFMTREAAVDYKFL